MADLSAMLDKNGILTLLPSSYYDLIPHSDLRIWCHHNARYGLPTLELINWLKDFIGDRKAIEIGSGTGDLAYHLGIKATDNRQQEWPDVALYYQTLRQPVISYPDFVEGLPASAAIEKYQPDIIVASWVTQWIDPNLPLPPEGGNMFGVKENEIVESGKTYILVGNTAIHGKKKIMSYDHKTYDFHFIRSRAADSKGNKIWIWN